jgi:hypothetical protein
MHASSIYYIILRPGFLLLLIAVHQRATIYVRTYITRKFRKRKKGEENERATMQYTLIYWYWIAI